MHKICVRGAVYFEQLSDASTIYFNRFSSLSSEKKKKMQKEFMLSFICLKNTWNLHIWLSELYTVGGVISWSNHQLFNICNCIITFSIVLTRELTSYPEALYIIYNIKVQHILTINKRLPKSIKLLAQVVKTYSKCAKLSSKYYIILFFFVQRYNIFT